MTIMTKIIKISLIFIATIIILPFITGFPKFYPGIKDEIEYCDVGTPATIRRYTLNPKGTAYGYAQIPCQAGRRRVKIQSPIPNLFFASAWTEPGHGFTGAIMSGYWCAKAIIRK